MTLDNVFKDASSIMTLVSLVTFLGIVWWAFISRRSTDFDAAAQLPFADDDAVHTLQDLEKPHG